MFKQLTPPFVPAKGITRTAALLVGLGCFSGAMNAQSYCASDGGNGNIFNIERVQFADLNNTSGDDNGYADFTAQTANLQQGGSYGVTLVPNGPFFLRYRWRVFIDWNDDGAFGAGELAFQRTGFGEESGTITVPVGTTGGTKRMRVNMSAFTYQGACANFSVGEVEDYSVSLPEACGAEAGTITISKPFICSTGESVNLQGTPDGNAVVPQGFDVLYVLTEGQGLVIQQVAAVPAFTVTAPGSYTIHTLVYDPATLDLSIVVPGTTTGFQVNSLLVQGGGSVCAALDVTGGAISVVQPNAGTLSGGGTVCTADEVVLTATPNGNSNTPDGYSLAYVLTSGTGLVIEQLGGAPEFTVTSGGLYTIHTFVFPSDLDLSVVEPGVTTGVDVLNLLAANNICASLDVAGAAFNVTNPEAGTLSSGGDVCLTGDGATLTATPNGDSNTPEGYSLAYVLTSGTGLVIEQLGGAPEFTVTSGGLYTIHTFVFPTSLDLSVVEPGVTTGVDVLNLLAANNICASLDVAGAAFNVTNPDAGTLSGGGDVCLSGDAATLTATPNGNSNTPEGYSLAYVLTSGTDLVIEQLGGSPEFTVTSGGLYTIHTFVFPTSLDLSVVVPGTTTGVDVLNLLAANNICASLDVAGAAFNVETCATECLAEAGDIDPASFVVCRQGGAATLTGIPAGNAVVPAGFQTLYVLTRGPGLVIRQVSATPQFTVNQLGIYTIHTLVYDPATLDLSIVVPGQTTGFDVNALLIQGGGSICASLDVQGAPQIVVGPFICSIINFFNNGIAPENMDDLNAVLASSGMNGASSELVMNTIEQDLPLNVMNMYPNPTRDLLTIDMAVLADTDLELSVLNSLGQEVLPGTSLNVGRGANRRVIDVSTLTPGSYLVRLTMNDRVLTHRFTKVD